MIELQHFSAKMCYTATGHLVVDNKILLIKHRKLKSWMSPGGHIDPDELPHQAAEREFFEETGINVKAFSSQQPALQLQTAELLPQPLFTNIHWVSKENYETRRKTHDSSVGDKTDANTDIKIATNLWKKGCEQHLGFVYLMKPTGSLEFYQNIEETDGIGWFSLEELADLEMIEDIRQEINWVFTLTLI